MFESDPQVVEIEANALRGLDAVQQEALAFQKTFPIGSTPDSMGKWIGDWADYGNRLQQLSPRAGWLSDRGRPSLQHRLEQTLTDYEGSWATYKEIYESTVAVQSNIANPGTETVGAANPFAVGPSRRAAAVGLGMRVFVSYRRGDVSGETDRLISALRDRFGRENVFCDIDTVGVGARFMEVIRDWIAGCDALLAVIGPRWLSALGDGQGQPIEDPADFVRLEIETALAHNVPSIPVLVDGARAPEARSLPASVRGLLDRNGLELSRRHWDLDVNDLIGGLLKLRGA